MDTAFHEATTLSSVLSVNVGFMNASIGRPRSRVSGTDDDDVVALHLTLPSIERAGRIDFGTYGRDERSSSRAFSSTAPICEVHQMKLRTRGDCEGDDES